MKGWMPLWLLLTLATPSWSADRDPPAAGDEDAPTLFERLLVNPREDAYTAGDRRRAAIERELPGITVEEAPASGFEQFLDTIANADINQAPRGQRVMIEKLNDPDFNRLPR